MAFDFNQRVRVRTNDQTRADSTADCVGYVAGKSQDEITDAVLAYAVFLDDRQRVYMIEPQDLIAEL